MKNFDLIISRIPKIQYRSYSPESFNLLFLPEKITLLFCDILTDQNKKFRKKI